MIKNETPLDKPDHSTSLVRQTESEPQESPDAIQRAVGHRNVKKDNILSSESYSDPDEFEAGITEQFNNSKAIPPRCTSMTSNLSKGTNDLVTNGRGTNPSSLRKSLRNDIEI